VTEQKQPNASLTTAAWEISNWYGWMKFWPGRKEKQDVIVFGHLPLWPEGEKHTAECGRCAKDSGEYGCVRAYLCGHNHAGGYGQENGIHYLNLPGAVNDPDGRTWAMIQVWPDRMEIQGTER